MDGHESYIRSLLEYGDVRLVNMSWGGGGEIITWPDASNDKCLIEHDALLIGSAGNDGKEHPSHGWQVPHTNPEYYGHFIVAMAVHVIPADWYDGHFSGEDLSEDPSYKLYRASYSNACGVAAQWCVGAVSDNQIPALHNLEVLVGTAGTSMSAPVVTGVAALVMEAYPWMSALNVQQTVSTTATDIGVPGVDEIYGWGLVNAAKAIHGPAQFVQNRFIDGFIADFSGGSRPFNNDIKSKVGYANAATAL